MPHRAGRLLALLYLLLAMPLAIRFALVTPPFQVADEPDHFFRAIQVGQGEMVAGHWTEKFIGGWLPPEAKPASLPFEPFRFSADPTGDAGALRAAARLGWGGAPERVRFSNTAIYPPVFYVPAALAIDAGRALGLPILTTLRLARVTDAVVGGTIAAAAIALAETGAPSLALVLSLPMTLSLFGSVSQDAMLIACAALAASLLTQRAAPLRLLAVGLLLGALAAARLSYLPLAVLPAVQAWRGKSRLAGLAAAAIAAAIGLLWLARGETPLFVGLTGSDTPFGHAQMQFLAAHPWRILPIAANTLRAYGSGYLREIVGVLGWLNIPAPARLCRIAGWTAAAAALLSLRVGRPRGEAILGALTLVLATGLVFGAMYAAWTPVGAPRVEGVQGRYFLPILAFVPVLLPRLAPSRLRGAAASALLVVFLFQAWTTMPRLVAHHFQAIAAAMR